MSDDNVLRVIAGGKDDSWSSVVTRDSGEALGDLAHIVIAYYDDDDYHRLQHVKFNGGSTGHIEPEAIIPLTALMDFCLDESRSKAFFDFLESYGEESGEG